MAILSSPMEAMEEVALVERNGFDGSMFVIPDDEPALIRGDVLAMNHTSPLQWATSLMTEGEPIVVNIKDFEPERVGRFNMLALASQSLLCMPHMPFEKAMPLQYSGRIVVTDFELMPRAKIDLSTVPLDHQGRAMTIEEAEQARRARVARYIDDPPVPLLFAVPVNGKAVSDYYNMVGRVLQGYPLTHLSSNDVMNALLLKLVGSVTRSEAFYFVVMVQALITGAYKMNFSTANVFPINGHGYIDDIPTT